MTFLKNGTVSEEDNSPRAEPHHHPGGQAGDHDLGQEPHPAGDARALAALDLDVVVVEADGAVAERHEQHDPDVPVAQVGPQQRRHRHAGQDHEPAHGRRALLGQMRLRAVLADRLALALLEAQQIDDGRPEQEHEQQRRHDGAAGAEGDVAEDIQRPDLLAEAHQHIEHSYPPGWLLAEPRQHGSHQRRHARAQRALDHHHVTRPHRVQQTIRQLGRGGGPRAAAGGGKVVHQQLHHRATGKNQIDARRVNRFFEAAMQVRRCVAQLQHVAQHGDAARELLARRGGHGRQRCPHGGGVGVVALVDQQDAGIGRAEQRARATAGGCGKRRQRRQGAHDVDAKRAQGGQHGQRIAHEVLARGADLVGEALRAVPGDDGRALRPEIDLHAAEIGLVVKAEGERSARRCSWRASRSSGKCGLSRGRTAVPPGTRPWKISALASAISSMDLNCARCTGSTVVMTATCGRTICGERRDLARMVHADLEHAVLRGLRHARQRQRHAPVVVVGLLRGMRGAERRQAQAQRFLGAGLADAAGDGDDLRVAADARRARHAFQRRAGGHRRAAARHPPVCAR